jgi:hypothetical protein
MGTVNATSRPRRSWAFSFLYFTRRVTPLALILYMGFRFEAWRDPVVIPTLLFWAVSILSFQAAIRRSVRQSRQNILSASSAGQLQADISKAA